MKEKTKNFGYVAILAGISFIVGSFLGGKLSDSSLSFFFHPSLPLWIAFVLSFFNLLFLVFFFYETSPPNKIINFNFFESFQNIYNAFKLKHVKNVYVIYFLFLLAWNFLFQFIPVFVIKRFSFTYSNIGDMCAFLGICWAFGAFISGKFLVNKFSGFKILEVVILCFIFPYFLIGFVFDLWKVFVLIGFCGCLGGIAWPLCNGIISELVPSSKRGKAMGISQSVQSLATTLAPVLGGVLVSFSLIAPFIVAAIISVFSLFIYIKTDIKKI